jgi:Amt family ammonium transporter
MVFQGMFPIIMPAIVIGLFVKRVRYPHLIVFVLLWTTLMHDSVAHWARSKSGWLRSSKLGALAFADEKVEHIGSGFVGLAVAIVVSRRLNYR